jgi:hypothetical protein
VAGEWPREPRTSFHFQSSGAALQVQETDSVSAAEQTGRPGEEALRVLVISESREWLYANGSPPRDRAAALARGLEAAGYSTALAVPASSVPDGADLRRWPDIRLWSSQSLNHVVRRLAPTVVLLCGLEALHVWDPTGMTTMAVCDLIGAPPDPPPPGLAHDLVKADAFSFDLSEDRAAWLPWLMLARVENLEANAVLAEPESERGLAALLRRLDAPSRRAQRVPLQV